MRLRAGTGALLLALGGCAGLPEGVRLDVDGRWIEVRRNGLGPTRWGLDPECREPAPAGDYSGLRIGPGGELIVHGRDGRKVRLFPCR